MLKGPIAHNTLRTSAVLGFRLLVQAGTLLLVARMLGPQQFGVFTALAALAVVLGTLATCGAHLVLLSEVSKEPARRQEILPYAIPCTLLCGSLLLLLYLMLCVYVLENANMALQVLLAIGLAELVLQPLLTLLVVEQQALGRIARSQLLLALPLFLRLLAALIVVFWQPNNPLLVFVWLYWLAAVTALFAGYVSLAQPWPALNRWHMPNGKQWRNMSGFGVLAITTAGPSELDKVLAVQLLPPVAGGLYAAGSRIIGAATLPVVAMMLSVLPRLFRNEQEPSAAMTRLLRWIIAACLIYSLLLATLLWFTAPVFAWVLGEQYEGVEQVVQWLCWVVPAMALRIAAGSSLMALGKPWMRAGFEVLGVITLIAGAVLLTGYFGMLGMALALGLGEWLMALLGIWLLWCQRQS
ncbi:oligosaccharide flippase family protein [Pseudomonas saudiphocaensis]|uniref:oligosaccharide flippase family protein n=1 Tax=Pseudomonas saudiphocaensis TaxID=1499686 RepID=UPI00187D43D3|nr:oligosaccharide flippase family protein [Pseudomonas saudiphocaensis]MBE7927345.1 oligosaccharide flippase family protein [Pseudomonas saudiphocaensis]